MRHVLVNRAKARTRLKRGGVSSDITLDGDRIALDEQNEALLHLDEALSQLAELEPRLARVVDCRFFRRVERRRNCRRARNHRADRRSATGQKRACCFDARSNRERRQSVRESRVLSTVTGGMAAARSARRRSARRSAPSPPRSTGGAERR